MASVQRNVNRNMRNKEKNMRKTAATRRDAAIYSQDSDSGGALFAHSPLADTRSNRSQGILGEAITAFAGDHRVDVDGLTEMAENMPHDMGESDPKRLVQMHKDLHKIAENEENDRALNRRSDEKMTNQTKEVLSYDYACDKKKPWYMIKPTCALYKVWDCAMIFNLVWLSLLVPFDVAFNNTMGTFKDTYYLNVLCLVMLAIDIPLTTFVCVRNYSNRTLIVDWHKVAWLYLRSGRVALDIISLVPWDVISRMAAPINIARVAKLYILSNGWLRRTYKPNNYRVFVVIFLELMWMMFFVHWISCFWIVCANLDQGVTGLWTSNAFWVYVDALYWAVTTITTVGYGDITPSTGEERLFAVVVMLIGVAMYAQLVGKLIEIFTSVNRDTDEFRDKMSFLNAYMNHHKIPKRLRRQIWEYYLFRWESGVSDDIFGDIASQVTPSLGTSIKMHDADVLMRKSPLLSAPGVRNATKRFLATNLTRQSFVPGQIIHVTGDVASHCYFIESGELTLREPYTDTVIRRHTQGGFFGMVDLVAYWFGEPLLEPDRSPLRSLNAKCETFVTVFALETEVFRDALSMDEDLKTAFAIDASGMFQAALHQLFGGLDETTLHCLAVHSSWVSCVAGRSLYLRGDPSNDLYVVISGSCVELADVDPGSSVKIVEPQNDHNEKKPFFQWGKKKDDKNSNGTVAADGKNDEKAPLKRSRTSNIYYHRGEIVGYGEILHNSPERRGSVFSITHCTFLRIPGPVFHILYSGCSHFRQQLAHALPIVNTRKFADKFLQKLSVRLPVNVKKPASELAADILKEQERRGQKMARWRVKNIDSDNPSTAYKLSHSDSAVEAYVRKIEGNENPDTPASPDESKEMTSPRRAKQAAHEKSPGDQGKSQQRDKSPNKKKDANVKKIAAELAKVDEEYRRVMEKRADLKAKLDMAMAT